MTPHPKTMEELKYDVLAAVVMLAMVGLGATIWMLVLR
jgi:hypothetical protein